MDFSIFISTPFGDEEAMKDFLFANALTHRDIAKSLIVQGNKVDSVPLTDMGNEDDWMRVHSDTHTRELTLLGIDQDIDLSTANLRDEGEFYDWMNTHALLHVYMNNVLGLT